MRLLILIIALSFVSSYYSQSAYNRWSLDAHIGFDNATRPFAEGYSSNYLTLLHADLGTRYMFSDKIGVKLDVGFDRIKNDEWGHIQGPQNPDGSSEFIKSKEFETHYFRLSLQAVANLGRVFDLQELNKNLGLLMHFGFGFSSLKDKKNSVWFKYWMTQGTDEMMNLLVGISPQYRISDHWAMDLDVTMVANAWQSKTWDFTENSFEKGLHGRIWNFSLGASYYFGSSGKGKKHMDWVVLHPRNGGQVSDTKKGDSDVNTEELADGRSKEGGNAEKGEDTEKANIDPEELRPGTPDTDGDGVPDADDDCPSVFGRGKNGCPNFDTDKDGIADSQDDCPETPGIIENNGCPQLDLEVKQVFQEVMNEVEFVVNDDELLEDSYATLDKLVKVINDHPEFSVIEIHGHTDNTGHAEPKKILSLARAKSVMDYLLSKGISPERMDVFGHGGEQPITSNDNPGGRAQNERIALKIRY